MTACVNLLKWIEERCSEMPDSINEEDEEDDDDATDTYRSNFKTCTNPECTKSRPGGRSGNKCVHECDLANEVKVKGIKPVPSLSPRSPKKGR